FDMDDHTSFKGRRLIQKGGELFGQNCIIFQHKSVAAKFDDVLPTSRMAEKAGHFISRQDTLPSASISVIGFSGELRPIHRRYPFEVYSEMFGLGALKGQSLGRAVQIDNQDRALLCCDTL